MTGAHNYTCDYCKDTHTMPATGYMCTRCPVPCPGCRQGGNGPFCEHTPCSCNCHKKANKVEGVMNYRRCNHFHPAQQEINILNAAIAYARASVAYEKDSLSISANRKVVTMRQRLLTAVDAYEDVKQPLEFPLILSLKRQVKLLEELECLRLEEHYPALDKLRDQLWEAHGTAAEACDKLKNNVAAGNPKAPRPAHAARTKPKRRRVGVK